MRKSDPEPVPRPNRRLNVEEERTLFMKEQTVLAKERTILSFMRTGLGFVTAGFAIIAASEILGRFFFIHTTVSFILGWSIVAFGFIEITESLRRLNKYRKKMEAITSELGDESV